MKKYIATLSVHKERAHTHIWILDMSFWISVYLSVCLSMFSMIVYQKIHGIHVLNPMLNHPYHEFYGLCAPSPHVCIIINIHIIYIFTYIYITHIHIYNIYIWHWVSHTVLPNVHLRVAAIAAGPSPWTSWNPKVRRAGPQSSVIRDLYRMARYTTYIYNITWRYSV